MLPTPDDVRKFLADTRADKRARLIEALLDRPEFADLWAHHLVKPLALTQSYVAPRRGAAYLHWCRSRIANDAGLDAIVRDMLVGKNVVIESGPVSFYSGARTPPEWADRAAANFLGVRLECMQCHSHPAARWAQDDGQSFTAFFSQVYVEGIPDGKKKTDLLLMDRSREWYRPGSNDPVTPRFLDGTKPKLKPLEDRRAVLADWVASPKNPYFARTVANRVWTHLHGKGFGDPESLHEQPVGANDALLDSLARELADNRFSLKHLVRLIMNSRTYQLSSRTNEHNMDDARYFSHAYETTRKSEVLFDAISQLLEMPARYEGMPPGTRAMQMLYNTPPLDTFSRPQKLSECTDSGVPPDDFKALDVWSMIHSDEFKKRLADPDNRIGRLLATKTLTDRDRHDELHLVGLGVLPDSEARDRFLANLAGAKYRRPLLDERVWGMIASTEFFRRR